MGAPDCLKLPYTMYCIPYTLDSIFYIQCIMYQIRDPVIVGLMPTAADVNPRDVLLTPPMGLQLPYFVGGYNGVCEDSKFRARTRGPWDLVWSKGSFKPRGTPKAFKCR